jgi:DNA invertase Pin-like site-specific DNA recombinase
MRIGYARVSTDDQNLDRQRAALADAGCDQVVEEVESGVKARNRLVALLACLSAGDELVVKSMDRLGRRAGELG